GYHTFAYGSYSYYWWPTLPVGATAVAYGDSTGYTADGVYYIPYLYNGQAIYVAVPPPYSAGRRCPPPTETRSGQREPCSTPVTRRGRDTSAYGAAGQRNASRQSCDQRPTQNSAS